VRLGIQGRMEAITSRPFLLSQWRVRPRTAAQASHHYLSACRADKAKVLLTAIHELLDNSKVLRSSSRSNRSGNSSASILWPPSRASDTKLSCSRSANQFYHRQLLFLVHASRPDRQSALRRRAVPRLQRLPSRPLLRRDRRFRGMALLPLQDVHAAVKELRRAVERHGMVGGILPAEDCRCRWARQFLPIFQEADRWLRLSIHSARLSGTTTVSCSQRGTPYYCRALINPL